MKETYRTTAFILSIKTNKFSVKKNTWFSNFTANEVCSCRGVLNV